MRERNWVWMGMATALVAVAAAAADKRTAPPTQVGLTSVGEAYFPASAGTVSVPVPNGDFEQPAGRSTRPAGWGASRDVKVVTGDDAPSGSAYLMMTSAKGTTTARTAELPVQANRPYLLTFWAKTSAAAYVACWSDVSRHDPAVNCIGWTRREVPCTRMQWKRVGVFVRPSPGSKVIRFDFRLTAPEADEGAEGRVAMYLDDVRLRTATEAEFAAAYAGWRKRLPARDLSVRPTDGKNLALFVAKLQRKIDTGRPLLIWAVGSSYTNMLGDGEHIRQIIRQRFPGAPEIIYKKRCGASVPWQYVRGWVRQVVIPEQPDLVLTYTIGKVEDLEKLIVDLRKHTTADIIVPSIHWRIRDKKNWGVSENAADQKVQPVREVCAKYGVEFVESRREWAEFMKARKMAIEIDPAKGMLKDAVHQSTLGQLVICENIGRHFAACQKPGYDWARRERIVPTYASLSADFTGNRVDLIGRRVEGGGTLGVRIDGKPASEAPAFGTTVIQFSKVAKRTGKRVPGLMSDRAPHGVLLGKHVVPQTWTIRMTSDKGEYELIGSVTGADGKGNAKQPFTSTSGQITVPPDLWRHVWFNRTGDEFTFDVVRTAAGEVSFAAGKGAPAGRFRVPLAQNLPNGKHKVELVVTGDGTVAVEGFHVYQPPRR